LDFLFIFIVRHNTQILVSQFNLISFERECILKLLSVPLLLNYTW